jgi:dTDP-4-dehydrorhamnose 3,5-epimerase
MNMRLRALPLAGAFIVEIEPHPDLRGFFARTWCEREFGEHGLESKLVQASISRNDKRGTLRGMHLQLPPSREAKLVRATRGTIYDVIIDLRPQSPTYLKHFGVELNSRRYDALYIPPQFAHGFQTVEDDTEVLYQMTDFHKPELAYGIRWDDAAFAIDWPVRSPITIVPRDAGYPNFNQADYELRLPATGAQARPAAFASERLR